MHDVLFLALTIFPITQYRIIHTLLCPYKEVNAWRHWDNEQLFRILSFDFCCSLSMLFTTTVEETRTDDVKDVFSCSQTKFGAFMYILLFFMLFLPNKFVVHLFNFSSGLFKFSSSKLG